jgi:MFS family permease
MLIAEAVTCFVCAPICGYMIDNKSSAKHLYLFGLIMLIASMLLFASANSLQVYIIARMPQGAAMAMVFVAGLTLIVECTPKDKIGYMFGYIDIFMVGGLISGPLLGGAIYHLAGYYAVFGMALILLSIDLILRLAIIDKATAQKWLSTQESGHESGVENTSATGYGSIERSAQHNDNIVHDTSIFWRLIREPRIVISALGILAYALLISAFETVSNDLWRLPNVLTHIAYRRSRSSLWTTSIGIR